MINLEYGLIIPRDPIRFRIVEGSCEPNIPVPPIITTQRDYDTTTRKDYDFRGVASGRRGGLVSIDGVALRLKGCWLERAFKTEEVYRKLRVVFTDTLCVGDSPEGGQVISDAQAELRWLKIYNEIISKEGFPVCNEPLGAIHYARKFKEDRRDYHDSADRIARFFICLFKNDLRNFDYYGDDPIAERLFNIGIHEEELGAAVMKIKGDTRLPEIYCQTVKSIEAASTVAYRFGLMAGAHKRLTENTFLWRASNSHEGNYIVFLENGSVHLAMTDFDGASKYQAVRNQLYRFLLTQKLPFTLRSKKGEEIGRIMSLAYREAPPFFRPEFRRGFKDGLRNPNKREPVTLELLCESFDLESPRKVHV